MLQPFRSSQGHARARPSRDSLWATCPRSASSGYHAEFHEGCYQTHTSLLCRWPLWNQTPFVMDEEKSGSSALHCWTSSSDISDYHADFHEGHGTIGAGQGRAWHVWINARHGGGTAWAWHAMCESALSSTPSLADLSKCAVFRIRDVNRSDIMFHQKTADVHWSGQYTYEHRTNTNPMRLMWHQLHVSFIKNKRQEFSALFRSHLTERVEKQINKLDGTSAFRMIHHTETASHAATHKLYLHAAIRWS